MANYTPNYGLHQWEPDDQFLRSDFNEDFAKIDTAIKQVAADASAEVKALDSSKASVVIGSYTGSGTNSSKTINLGFYPQAVLLESQTASRTYSSSGGTYGGLALRNNNVGGSNATLTVTTTGFKVCGYSNVENSNYYYIAFR